MIGIFDSGVGGLTVAREIMRVLPEHDILYLGDTARTPYGSKSRQTVVKYSKQNIEFLLSKGAELVVMACNTASSVSSDIFLENYDVKIFEVISPATRQALEVSTKGCIGIIGTRATVSSGVYEKKLKQQNKQVRVYSKACPLFVPLVEEGWIKKPETRMIVKKYLHSLKVNQIDTLILGCTHYPILKDIIAHKIGKRVNIVDSSIEAAKTVKQYLEKHADVALKLAKNSRCQIYVTDKTEQFNIFARQILKKKVDLLEATIE